VLIQLGIWEEKISERVVEDKTVVKEIIESLGLEEGKEA